jgi:hypothetical protein
MSQSYESIGQGSPEIEAVAAQHNGWNTDVSQPMIDQETDTDTSFWAGRANIQALSGVVSHMAGYNETPAAAIVVHPQ